MNAKELREKRAGVAAEVQKLADKANSKKDSWVAEDEKRWTDVNADYDALSKKIEIAERAEKVDSEQREISERSERIGRENYDSRDAANKVEFATSNKITSEDRAKSLQAWAMAQSGLDIEDEQRDMAKRCGINVNAQFLDMPLNLDYSQVKAEIRAMNTSDESHIIPAGFVPKFERAMSMVSGVRPYADILRTATGNALTWPTTNDTSNSGALVSEAASVTGGTDVSTSAMTLNAYKYTSKIILISAELLQDNAVNLVNVLGEICGERIGRALNTAYTTGTGSEQPNGIVTASTLGGTCASASAVTMDEVLDLVYGLDAAYRPQASFMCNDAVTLALRKLKDSNNQYLWQTSTQMGQPDRLLSYPVYPNSAMASTIEASAKVLLFGDLSYYKIRDIGQIRLRRLVERYADTDEEGMVVFYRTDADLLDAGTHPVKHLIMHS